MHNCHQSCRVRPNEGRTLQTSTMYGSAQSGANGATTEHTLKFNTHTYTHTRKDFGFFRVRPPPPQGDDETCLATPDSLGNENREPTSRRARMYWFGRCRCHLSGGALVLKALPVHKSSTFCDAPTSWNIMSKPR